MKAARENDLGKEVVETRRSKKSVLVVLTVAMMLFTPAQISADWTFEDFKSVAGKVVKKITLPVAATVHGVASAAEAYADGRSASEVVGYGLGGVVEHIGNNITETANDIAKITEVAVDTYNGQ